MAAPFFWRRSDSVDLDFVRIECDVIADTPAQLTAALYNSLRDFEVKFKVACCPALMETCASCTEKIGCPHRIIFAQQLSADPEIVRLHQKPSLPFSLYVNGPGGDITSCTVGLVIIGSAVNYLEIFHAALIGMVEAAVTAVLPPTEYRLTIYSLDYQGVRHEIRSATSLTESIILLSGQHILQNTVHSDSVRLTLTSPLRLLQNGSIAHHFDFAMFLRSQLRRCSSLYTYYGSGKMDLDFTALSLAALNIAVLEDGILYTQPHWSKLQNKAGLTGSADLTGLVEPMFSLLILGSYFNAGKGATYGSGSYRLEEF
jgi:hypothetical protein